MFNRKSLTRSVAVCASVLGLASTSHAQIPPPPPEKPPVRVQLKPAAAPGQPAAGPLGALGVALEIQAQQSNVPAGLRGTIVVTNNGTEPVEFLDPRDSSQLEIQTADGKSLRPAPVAPSSLVNIPGAKAQAPVRLAPKESRRIDLVVSEVVAERTGPAVPQTPTPGSSASPSAARSNVAALLGGKYRVRARVRIISAQGKPGEARPSPSFESPWVDVTFGPV
jgi:hypothetical protein